MKNLIPVVMTLCIFAPVFGQISVNPAATESGSITVQDIDGNLYNTIKTGQQIWMDRNLETTRYSDGSPIPNISGDNEWKCLNTGAYCFFNNDPATYRNTYGALYNWYTVVDKRNLCPEGWRIPTDTDWKVLETYLGGSKGSGGKLKEAGFAHWINPNTGGTNFSGFSALPGGIRYFSGPFPYLGGYGYWWSSTESLNNLAITLTLSNNNENMNRNTSDKGNGYSVRCLKD